MADKQISRDKKIFLLLFRACFLFTGSPFHEKFTVYFSLHFLPAYSVTNEFVLRTFLLRRESQVKVRVTSKSQRSKLSSSNFISLQLVKNQVTNGLGGLSATVNREF